MQVIYLKVLNVQELDVNSSNFHIFDERGGSIGSGSDNAWIINDKNHQIKNIQAQINFEEGIFGLKPYDKECKVFLNDSFSTLPYSYETQISFGDLFKIGEIQIKIMSKEEFIQEQDKSQSVDELGELGEYNAEDIEIESKGVEHNFNPTNNQELDLLQEDDDVLGLSKSQDAILTAPNIQQDYFVSYKNIQEMISKRVKSLQEQHSLAHPLNFTQNKLKMLELQSRIEHFSLIEDKEILNLLILSLLCESLKNSTLESLHPDFFEKSISEIIEDCINGNGNLLKNALLNILSQQTEDRGKNQTK